MTEKIFAHVRQNESGDWLIHGLMEHSQSVAALGRASLERLGNSGVAELGYLAGLWHDLGKYREAFQQRIKSLSGYDALDAHLETLPGRVNHSTAGGIFAQERLGEQVGLFLAFMILGHHTGLQDHDRVADRLSDGRDTKKFLEEIRERIAPVFFEQYSGADMAGFQRRALLCRMLFSALVDADFRDTAAFMQPDRPVPSTYDLRVFDFHLDAHLAELQAGASGTVNKLRKDVLGHVQKQADLAPGFFTLTVPTGGGKTLASLSFAFKHALRYGKRRVIYVIPYTSIIEQTARVFREILGDDAVLEHHSNLDPADASRENPTSRIRAENWDAPIVVTTSVQFFESLFARRTSRCRKLHNIIDSVVVLDEAQLLPPDFLQPIVGALRELTAAYKTSVVLCTATQPALNSESYGRENFAGIDDARELAPDTADLHEKLKRVRLHLPVDFARADGREPESVWDEIAGRIQTHRGVLTIVNTRADARRLAQLIPDAHHLSTSLCGAHRTKVLETIRERLRAGSDVRVVSTQLIEAGVDIDFPVVFRALTGLDSIAQAAGRCNREGRLAYGDVFVFVPPTRSPPGHLWHAEQAGRLILERGGDVLHPDAFREYFRQLFYSKKSLDARDIEKKERLFLFEQTATAFRMIPEATPVIVPYEREGLRLIDCLRKPDATRNDLRAAQRYAVNVLDGDLKKLCDARSVELLTCGVYILSNHDLYDRRFGLRLDQPTYHTEDTLVI